MPIEAAADLLVLSHIPEGAVVGGINLHGAVVTPTAQAGLRSSTFNEADLALQRTRRIARYTAGKAVRGMDTAAGSAVADGNVGVLIFRRARHPAPGGIWSVGALLVESNRAGRVIKFVPANGPCAAIEDRIVQDRAIVIGKMPHGKAVHLEIAECVET